MVKELRRRFICIVMLSLLAVMIVLLVGINVAKSAATRASLDDTLTYLARNEGVFPSFTRTVTETSGASSELTDASGEATVEEASGEASDTTTASGEMLTTDGGMRFYGRFEQTAESEYETRYFTVVFDTDGNIVDTNTQNIASVTAEEAKSMAIAKRATGSASGWSGQYRWQRSQRPGGETMMLFLDARRELDDNRTSLGISCVIGLAAYVLEFLFVLGVSARAVRPMMENLEQQSRFITGASHELKTPLTVISATNDMIAMQNGPTEWTDRIRSQTDKMRTMINGLVLLSRLDEENAVPPEKLPFDLSGAVTDTVMAFADPAQAREVRFVCDIEPDIAFTGEEAAVRRVASVLTDNAVKYCDPGGTVCVRLEGDRHPILTVTNDYARAGELQTERLCERFYRADSARTGGTNSYGLGLSIADSICRALHWKMDIRTPAGSSFEIAVRF